jgi:Fe-S-cluster containining protein
VVKRSSPLYTLPFHRRETLRFECTGCGACCRGSGESHVFLEPGEAETIRLHLGLSTAWFRRRYLTRTDEGEAVLAWGDEPGCCVFLGGDGRCRIYPVRPLQCRTYPFWPEVVATRKSWEQEAVRCEGIGRGEPVSVTRIEAELRRQR